MEDSSLTFYFVIIFGCLVSSAFFSASETALTAVSRARLFNLIKAGNRNALRVRKLRDKKDALLGTVLLGNTLVNIACAAVGTLLFVKFFGEELGTLYATIVMTVLVLIFCEVLPKTVAFHHTEAVALIIARPMSLIIRLLWPFTKVVQVLVWAILRLFGMREASPMSATNALEVLRGSIEMHHHEGAMVKQDRDMLGSIIDLNDREVEEIMIHRKNVFSLDMAMEPEMLLEKAMSSAYSRIPLYRDSSDNIVGVVHIKDLIRLVRQQKIGLTREMIRRVAQRPWFVPETTTLVDQLVAFRTKRKHFACVVDEYGAWMGIVTLEDIIEEIVGEIADEHDPFGIADVIPYGESAFKVAGTVTIRDVNRQLNWDLPDAHATTVAGLVLHEARCIPDAGAVFEFYGYRFTVAEKRVNQLIQLIVEKLAGQDDDFDDAQE